MKKHINHANKTEAPSSLMNFVFEKKWFVLFIDIFLLAILVIALSSMQPSYSAEKADYAKQLYAENTATLDQMILDMNTLIAQAPASTLDDDYYHSIKDDMLWLKSKQDSVFNSKPSNEVAVKEVAFTTFMESIIQLNDDFTMDIGTPNYEERINYALNVDINYPTLLSEDEAKEMFKEWGEESTFRKEIRTLFEEYISNKKVLLNTADSLERKYVEAKKIIWISYGDQ